VLELDIDEFGRVANARVTSSTSSRLEQSALEAARKFRYQKELVGNRFVAVNDVSATIHFHYRDLAEAAGCAGFGGIARFGPLGPEP
jgi:TonB family protein